MRPKILMQINNFFIKLESFNRGSVTDVSPKLSYREVTKSYRDAT